MHPDAAKTLISDTFDGAYDETRLRTFIQNLLVEPDMKDKEHRSGQMVYESFREHVASYKRLAKYTDPNGEEMDVLAVKLKTPHKLERARTMQRNFAATYLKQPARQGREAALVAYYADGTDDWRLSFVQLEYRTVVDEETGDVKAEEELTHVRYTFLVGENEPSHTPKRQFAPLLQSEELRFPPPLHELKDAFDIEVVTDEFFEAYRGHYKTLTEDVEAALAEDETAQDEFDEKDVTPEAFAEKLTGQLVFLYFLQKKGWLGVQRGDDWGEGPGNFLRQLYEGEYVDYDNFYRDVLEPLFYQGLAVDRGGDNYFSALRCRVPFLNGGLFQPIHNVDRSRVHLPLPDETFGDIFDTFDRYNFTVREDEPLDKEVAVDPEMLGKVFEKLLLDDRQKELGAFYTPRDIVHYMCQQNLVDHLDTELNVREAPLTRPEPRQQNAFGDGPTQQGVLSGEDYNPQVERHHLEALVRDGSGWIEHDSRTQESESTNGKYSEYKAPRPIRTHAREIDAVLSDVRICDPAVGSGAFPVGMMQEIVQARQVLDTYIDDEIEREAYPLKRHAIQHSLHGVDIDPSAIDIAQLRLWLSLVVDEEDFEDIRPLPNLRYKFVQGDALQKIERSFFNNEQEAQLHALMEEFVSTAHPSEKERLQEQIDEHLSELLGDGQFDFGLYFGTVFKEQDGFDVVIGNPPYVTAGNLTDQQKDALKGYEIYKKSADYCTYFVERGMNLLRPDGQLAYIIKNKWLRARYGNKLRRWLKSRELTEIIDFKDLPVFQGVIAYPCIFRGVNASSDESLQAVEVEHLIKAQVLCKRRSVR
jgi:type I restriction-modification system DNA methylase subunit